MHLIVDNYAKHKHADVKAWLARRPRFHIHFTPTGSSWLNLVERFFADITQDAVRDRRFHQRARQFITAIEGSSGAAQRATEYRTSGAPKARRSLLKSSARASRRSRPINYANFSDRTLDLFDADLYVRVRRVDQPAERGGVYGYSRSQLHMAHELACPLQ